MAIKPTFKGDIDKVFKALLNEVERQIIETLHHVGEMAVEHAKMLPPTVGFNDQTAKLRSSIGYAVFKDGKNITGGAGFHTVAGGVEGTKKGQELAASIGSKFKGYTLVVVAGMSYAVYVEKGHKLPNGKMTRPRDVLTSAERIAMQQANREFQDLLNNIANAFK